MIVSWGMDVWASKQWRMNAEIWQNLLILLLQEIIYYEAEMGDDEDYRNDLIEYECGRVKPGNGSFDISPFDNVESLDVNPTNAVGATGDDDLNFYNDLSD